MTQQDKREMFRHNLHMAVLNAHKHGMSWHHIREALTGETSAIADTDDLALREETTSEHPDVTVLSAQSIRHLRPVSPLREASRDSLGNSGGLGPCGYDLTLMTVKTATRRQTLAAAEKTINDLRMLMHGIFNGDPKAEQQARELLYGKPERGTP